MGMKIDVNIAGVSLKNPVMPASGTFGSGKEYEQFIDINRLGAVVVKGVSSRRWNGNPPPRIAETYGGMLNAVGLQNPGVDEFIKNDIPFLSKFDTKIIVNVCGHSLTEYCEVVEQLNDQNIDMYELNISCPNVSNGGITFGTNCNQVELVVSEVKKIAKKPLIVKLTPNVTDITEIAKAAESAGADALSLINTLLGMRIDIKKKKPILGNVVGGLSGSPIMPVAVRMVYQVARATSLPIIGMGGISTGEDAIEFLMAGATAVAVGTANFKNPCATTDVLEGIEKYMIDNNIDDISDIKLQ